MSHYLSAMFLYFAKLNLKMSAWLDTGCTVAQIHDWGVMVQPAADKIRKHFEDNPDD